MKYFLSPLFKRLIKKLDFQKNEEIKRAISELIAFFESGVRSEGLGLKRLHGNYWEIRASIRDRILFSFDDDEISFLIVGNHDEVKHFLRQI
jgi:mRNA-degrading endonuclease RelE of RelBE toxin-antitoxin system